MSVLWSQSDARLTDAVARGGQIPPRRSPARPASRLPTLGRVEGKGPHGWAAPLHAAVLEATAVGPATTLLDLGCGTGLFARAATDRGPRVTGIDLDPAAVARAPPRCPRACSSWGTPRSRRPGRSTWSPRCNCSCTSTTRSRSWLRRARAGAVVAATVWGREEECD